MSTYELNEQQRAAVEATGEVFVSAGAGTGKTAVLVERVVRAVLERGLDVDSILVITYTRRAAGELRTRIRAAFAERGRHDLARELDGAWISTIHGFCARLLRAYPLAAGLDPRFRELDDSQGAVLRSRRRSARRSPSSSRETTRSGSSCSRRTAAPGCGGCSRPCTRRCAPRGVSSTSPSRRGLSSRSASRSCATPRGRWPAIPTRPRRSAAPRPSSSRCSTATRGPTGSCRSPGSRRAATAPRRMAKRSPPSSRRRSTRRRPATVRSSRSCSTRSPTKYAEAKARESALDFEDLQLEARDLLRAHPDIREREQLRFREILVDEFQDTNALQTEIVELLRTPETELFFVGDEFQSIYGFRHADVAVFRERRAAAETLLSLTNNYRSRPEVLAAVNYLFGSHFGSEFQELSRRGRVPRPRLRPSRRAARHRQGELQGHARALAARRGAGGRAARARARRRGDGDGGEIVLLFAAGTDAEWYEQELRREGLPTYRATGKGYFGQQQVVDMLMYLRLLQNRYDDAALLAVLASPFVGVSNDALALVRRGAFRKPLFSGIEHAMPPGLAERDERLLRAFRQRYDRLVAAMPRLSLERLCEQLVAEHDYDLAVLAQWDGRRRYANMRKLARLARSYEELRGPDVEGFVRFVAEQEAVGAHQLEAVAEEEGADAVRLLTIHAAKGLEFKVVIVADAGRDRVAPSPDEILALPDGRFGFRVADPVTTKRRGAFDYEAVEGGARRRPSRPSGSASTTSR